MNDLDAALALTAPEPITSVTVTPSPPRCRHRWGRYEGPESDYAGKCLRCGAWMDLGRVRLGRSSARLGKDQERRIERTFGPRKVGEFGDAIDLLGRDFAWQSKATRGPMPAWLAAVDAPIVHAPTQLVKDAIVAMLPILGTRYPLVIQSWVRNGSPTRDRIWVMGDHWRLLHGAGPEGVWLAMSGEHFMQVHGRDQEEER